MPFEVPGNWVWCKIEDIGEVITGNTPSKDRVEYYGGDIPFFKPTDLEQGIDTKYASDHLSELGFEQSRKLPANTILVTCIGATIGKTGIITVAGSCNQQINAIVPNKEVTHSFIFYVCVSDYMQSEIISNASATTLPILNKGNFANLLFPLPPIVEQRRIVTNIERWFALIDQIEQDKSDLQTIIKQAKSKILELAIHGRLVPQDPNDEPASELLKRINPKAEVTCDNGHSEKFPFEIPDTWVWCSHNSILDISGGAQPAKSYFETTPKPNYIRLYQIRDYGESPVPIYIPISLASKQTEKGDILLARYGGSLGKVFHAEQGAYNVAMAKVIFKFDNLIYKEFAYYYYLSDLYQNKLKEISRTAQAGFNSTDFNDMYFPLPPLAEQQRIVVKIEELFSILDDIQKSLEA